MDKFRVFVYMLMRDATLQQRILCIIPTSIFGPFYTRINTVLLKYLEALREEGLLDENSHSFIYALFPSLIHIPSLVITMKKYVYVYVYV